MSIRLRLAAWCVAIFCALFVGLAIIIYTVHARAHYRDVDDTLAAITSHYQSEIEQRIATGTVLSRSVVASLNVEGQQLVGSQLTIYDAAGQVIFGRVIAGATPMAVPSDSSPHGSTRYLTVDTPDGRVRVHTLPLTDGTRTAGYVQTSVSLVNLDRSIARFRLLLMAAMVGGLLVALGGSLATAARALRPIADMTETARAIALSRAFGRRLDPISQNDELGELSQTFNEMLASLNEAHQSQRRFVDDAAHELRAPLTSILGNLDLLERARDLPESEHQAVVADVRAEAERLGRLVGELLMLARADAGQKVARDLVELDRLTVEVVRQMAPMADGISFEIADLIPTAIRGDADRLRQLLVILVENALRYTPAGGKVLIALRQCNGEAVLSVSDTGIGIAAADLPHVFDRFFRADQARSRVVGGSGLGLAIAKWIVEAHDGRIDVSSHVGVGSTFTSHFPTLAQSILME